MRDKLDLAKHAFLFFATMAILFPSCKTEQKKHPAWSNYGGGADQSKYVVVEDINKNTVNQLKLAWSYATGDDRVYQWNPIVVDTIMYVLAKNSSLVALNAITGKEIWIHANLRGITGRGINYWESEDRKDRRLLFQMNNYLQAIDALTGKEICSNVL